MTNWARHYSSISPSSRRCFFLKSHREFRLNPLNLISATPDCGAAGGPILTHELRIYSDEFSAHQPNSSQQRRPNQSATVPAQNAPRETRRKWWGQAGHNRIHTDRRCTLAFNASSAAYGQRTPTSRHSMRAPSR